MIRVMIETQEYLRDIAPAGELSGEYWDEAGRARLDELLDALEALPGIESYVLQVDESAASRVLLRWAAERMNAACHACGESQGEHISSCGLRTVRVEDRSGKAVPSPVIDLSAPGGAPQKFTVRSRADGQELIARLAGQA